MKALIASMAVLSAICFAPRAQAQLPGPVMTENSSVSQLPRKATEFIQKYYHNAQVVKCEFEPGRGGLYEVDLDNGVEMEFDSKGGILEISAPDNRALSPNVVRAILPVKAYNFLMRNSFNRAVESVEFQKNGIEVDLVTTSPDKIMFNPQGEFKALLRD